MKQLSGIIEQINYRSSTDLESTYISSIVTDSRKVLPGSLFVALKGLTVDGHQFVWDAVENGCSAIVVDQNAQVDLPEDFSPVIVVPDSREVLGDIAAAFYGHPSQELLRRAANVGAAVLRTDELGSIEVVTDGREMWWQAGN